MTSEHLIQTAIDRKSRCGLNPLCVTLRGYIGSSSPKWAIGIGFGDAIYPEPELASFLFSLSKAIFASFERRGTAIPTTIPFALTQEFLNDPQKDNNGLHS